MQLESPVPTNLNLEPVYINNNGMVRQSQGCAYLRTPDHVRHHKYCDYKRLSTTMLASMSGNF